ncbi:MAG TPA: diaminopimelate decarboxylase [Terriglobales bacterium]|nr:diaminopimelate decarboxylase [Terriglobales bacterium]
METPRPPAFVYRSSKKSSDAALYCEDVPLDGLARRFGTPLYVYSRSAIERRLRDFHAAFRGVRHSICYSVKANSNLSLLRLINALGCGFDVVSGGELQRVLKAAPRAASKVVFSGVGKTREEITAALRAGILIFNVESESELALLADCAARLKKTARVAVRVNPEVPAETHPYISTGLHKHKFGVPMQSAWDLYRQAAEEKYLTVAGVSVHIGSQIMDVAPFAAAMKRVAELVRALQSEGHKIDYVDAGGGLGIAYESSALPEFAKYVEQYAAVIARPLRGLNVVLLLEPGRSIVGPAGALVTSVLYRKVNDSKRFLIVDAAMNDLMRPSLYQAYHEIIPVKSRQGADSERVDVVGPVCETGDFLARDRELPVVDEGDLLAVLDTGAYGMALSSNYNTRPRAAEVLVKGRSVKLIRRRETLIDLCRNEI